MVGGASLVVCMCGLREPLQVFCKVTSLAQVRSTEKSQGRYMEIHHAVLEFSKLCQCRYVGLCYSADFNHGPLCNGYLSLFRTCSKTGREFLTCILELESSCHMYI